MHIDWWTLALQAINVLILVWILGRFFYRPVAAIIEARRAAAEKLVADAEAAEARVKAKRAEIDATRAGFEAERDRVLAEARAQALAERDAAMKEVSADIARLRADAQSALTRERKQMEIALIDHAGSLAVDIAQKLLKSLPPGIATSGFLESLSDQLRSLPSSSRALLVAAASSTGLSVATASPLDDAEQAQCRAIVENVLGTSAKISFRSEPSLIAGFELRSDTFLLKRNWRDDLSVISEQLRTDGRRNVIS